MGLSVLQIEGHGPWSLYNNNYYSAFPLLLDHEMIMKRETCSGAEYVVTPDIEQAYIVSHDIATRP